MLMFLPRLPLAQLLKGVQSFHTVRLKKKLVQSQRRLALELGYEILPCGMSKPWNICCHRKL